MGAFDEFDALLGGEQPTTGDVPATPPAPAIAEVPVTPEAQPATNDVDDGDTSWLETATEIDPKKPVKYKNTSDLEKAIEDMKGGTFDIADDSLIDVGVKGLALGAADLIDGMALAVHTGAKPLEDAVGQSTLAVLGQKTEWTKAHAEELKKIIPRGTEYKDLTTTIINGINDLLGVDIDDKEDLRAAYDNKSILSAQGAVFQAGKIVPYMATLSKNLTTDIVKGAGLGATGNLGEFHDVDKALTQGILEGALGMSIIKTAPVVGKVVKNAYSNFGQKEVANVLKHLEKESTKINPKFKEGLERYGKMSEWGSWDAMPNSIKLIVTAAQSESKAAETLLRRMSVHGTTQDLVRKIIADSEQQIHKDLGGINKLDERVLGKASDMTVSELQRMIQDTDGTDEGYKLINAVIAKNPEKLGDILDKLRVGSKTAERTALMDALKRGTISVKANPSNMVMHVLNDLKTKNDVLVDTSAAQLYPEIREALNGIFKKSFGDGFKATTEHGTLSMPADDMDITGGQFFHAMDEIRTLMTSRSGKDMDFNAKQWAQVKESVLDVYEKMTGGDGQVAALRQVDKNFEARMHVIKNAGWDGITAAASLGDAKAVATAFRNLAGKKQMSYEDAIKMFKPADRKSVELAMIKQNATYSANFATEAGTRAGIHKSVHKGMGEMAIKPVTAEGKALKQYLDTTSSTLAHLLKLDDKVSDLTDQTMRQGVGRWMANIGTRAYGTFRDEAFRLDNVGTLDAILNKIAKTAKKDDAGTLGLSTKSVRKAATATNDPIVASLATDMHRTQQLVKILTHINTGLPDLPDSMKAKVAKTIIKAHEGGKIPDREMLIDTLHKLNPDELPPVLKGMYEDTLAMIDDTTKAGSVRADGVPNAIDNPHGFKKVNSILDKKTRNGGFALAIDPAGDLHARVQIPTIATNKDGKKVNLLKQMWDDAGNGKNPDAKLSDILMVKELDGVPKELKAKIAEALDSVEQYTLRGRKGDNGGWHDGSTKELEAATDGITPMAKFRETVNHEMQHAVDTFYHGGAYANTTSNGFNAQNIPYVVDDAGPTGVQLNGRIRNAPVPGNKHIAAYRGTDGEARAEFAAKGDDWNAAWAAPATFLWAWTEGQGVKMLSK